jgi:hypothetical protein
MAAAHNIRCNCCEHSMLPLTIQLPWHQLDAIPSSSSRRESGLATDPYIDRSRRVSSAVCTRPEEPKAGARVGRGKLPLADLILLEQ